MQVVYLIYHKVVVMENVNIVNVFTTVSFFYLEEGKGIVVDGVVVIHFKDG